MEWSRAGLAFADPFDARIGTSDANNYTSNTDDGIHPNNGGYPNADDGGPDPNADDGSHSNPNVSTHADVNADDGTYANPHADDGASHGNANDGSPDPNPNDGGSHSDADDSDVAYAIG